MIYTLVSSKLASLPAVAWLSFKFQVSTFLTKAEVYSSLPLVAEVSQSVSPMMFGFSAVWLKAKSPHRRHCHCSLQNGTRISVRKGLLGLRGVFLGVLVVYLSQSN